MLFFHTVMLMPVYEWILFIQYIWAISFISFLSITESVHYCPFGSLRLHPNEQLIKIFYASS